MLCSLDCFLVRGDRLRMRLRLYDDALSSLRCTRLLFSRQPARRFLFMLDRGVEIETWWTEVA